MVFLNTMRKTYTMQVIVALNASSRRSHQRYASVMLRCAR
jgi:hypothetical protein